jgi:hypothetical protein
VSAQEAAQNADFVRRGWLHIATKDTTLRETLRHIPTSSFGSSALDVLDGLVRIIDALEARALQIDGRKLALPCAICGWPLCGHTARNDGSASR